MERPVVTAVVTMAYSRRNKTYRFHLLGLVHLPVSRRYMGCAFTQKIEKLSRMLLSYGHEVILYGAESSDAPCTEFVQTHTLREIQDTWGDGDNRYDIGYDWKQHGFRHDFNTERTQLTLRYYARCVQAIEQHKRPDDFLLVMQGTYQKPIADAVGLWLTVEPGIGYRGSFARFRAFESRYLQNFTYGSKNPFQSVNGAYYDRTIPNYFDPEDFPFVPASEREDYYLYIGRLIERKGVMTAVKAVDAIGGELLVAGQGDMKIASPNVKMLGYVDPGDRAYYMGHAKAVFVPTLYLEAFGGVNVEAQLCGTPVITTDFGVFPETVAHGITGFRCSTLHDFVRAAKLVDQLDNEQIHLAAQHYSMDNVMREFQQWFDDLYQLYRSAHEDGVPGWHWLPAAAEVMNV